MTAPPPPALAFAKYHGAGNDFVCVDDRTGAFAARGLETRAFIAALCARHTGVGADGLVLLRVRDDLDAGDGAVAAADRADGASSVVPLRMVYYNADGAPSSFCGNGARCFLRFAHDLGLLDRERDAAFEANDGSHRGCVRADGSVRVSMRVSAAPRAVTEAADVLDTGSPHYVWWRAAMPSGPIAAEARAIRDAPPYAAAGINVNFAVRLGADHLALRTYERGVEDETLACGTGITAAAISAAARDGRIGAVRMRVAAEGGELLVEFERQPGGGVRDVYLTGPAVRVFEGVYSSSPAAASASAARSFL